MGFMRDPTDHAAAVQFFETKTVRSYVYILDNTVSMINESMRMLHGPACVMSAGQLRDAVRALTATIKGHFKGVDFTQVLP